MKRPMVLIACLLAALLTACAAVDKESSANDRISVVATIFAPYDFARVIAGENADITMLLPPAAECHSYEPTPQDILLIQDCDIFIYAGGSIDSWADGILDAMDKGDRQAIALLDCVLPLAEEPDEGMKAEADNAGAGVSYDEHVWTAPLNAKLISQKIADAFAVADATHADTYQRNAEAYHKQLDELDAAFRSVTKNAARNTIVFGDRFPFRYLADAYDLEYYAALPGCATETEPSAKTIAFLIDKIKAENIPVVFHAELSNGKIAATLSEPTGAKVLPLHACHNISRSDFQRGVSYLELMNRNVDALKEALY